MNKNIFFEIISCLIAAFIGYELACIFAFLLSLPFGGGI